MYVQPFKFYEALSTIFFSPDQALHPAKYTVLSPCSRSLETKTKVLKWLSQGQPLLSLTELLTLNPRSFYPSLWLIGFGPLGADILQSSFGKRARGGKCSPGYFHISRSWDFLYRTQADVKGKPEMWKDILTAVFASQSLWFSVKLETLSDPRYSPSVLTCA